MSMTVVRTICSLIRMLTNFVEATSLQSPFSDHYAYTVTFSLCAGSDIDGRQIVRQRESWKTFQRTGYMFLDARNAYHSA